MTNAEKLKPCPFCGGKAEGPTLVLVAFDGAYHKIQCAENCCEIMTDTEAHAVAKWNKRALEAQ